jgi:hypothetical protein
MGEYIDDEQSVYFSVRTAITLPCIAVRVVVSGAIN